MLAFLLFLAACLCCVANGLWDAGLAWELIAGLATAGLAVQALGWDPLKR